MRAAILHARRELSIEQHREPQAGDGEVIVKVVLCGICGSDLARYRDIDSASCPLIMGHEFVGVIDGETRVAVNPLLSCGTCTYCVRHHPELCIERALIGVHRDGGFADFVSVPKKAVYPIPHTLSWEKAALVEPTANAMHCVGQLSDFTRSVCIIGAGPIGILCGLVAQDRGLQVHMVDISEDSLRECNRIGLEASRSLPDGSAFDAVIDAVGAESTRKLAVEVCRRGGQVIWVGLASAMCSLPSRDVVRNEVTISGSFAYSSKEFSAALNFINRSAQTPSTLAVDFSEVPSTFAQLDKGHRPASKVLAKIMTDR